MEANQLQYLAIQDVMMSIWLLSLRFLYLRGKVDRLRKYPKNEEVLNKWITIWWWGINNSLNKSTGRNTIFSHIFVCLICSLFTLQTDLRSSLRGWNHVTTHGWLRPCNVCMTVWLFLKMIFMCECRLFLIRTIGICPCNRLRMIKLYIKNNSGLTISLNLPFFFLAFLKYVC